MSERITDIPDDTRNAAGEIVGQMGGIVTGNDRAEVLAFILHLRDRAAREQAFTEAKADCRASHTVEVQRLNAVTAERDSLKSQVQETGRLLAVAVERVSGWTNIDRTSPDPANWLEEGMPSDEWRAKSRKAVSVAVAAGLLKEGE